VLGQTLKALALRAHEKGLELVSAVDPDVPDGLIGDSGRLRQILVNLVGNALKFTERGEVVIRVAMGGAGAGEADLHFSVTDTGIGIATDKVERVFAAFTQADSSTTRRYGGTGLGLTISERLVGRMGGRIWVESEEGRGSAFHFTARFGLGTAPPRETPALDVTDLPGLSVLIVDDHPTSRRVIGEMLARRGLRPTIVASGGAALSALEDARARGGLPQLVVTDLQMPELDGFGLVELMKAEPELADIPVVMVSSSGLPAEAVLARELGIGAYLTKPVTEPELISAILTVLHLPAAAGTRPSRAAALPALAPAQRLRVLLAEDNVINQRVAVHVLERLGHRVVVAGTGRAALTALEEQAFDVVLMDVQMPEMDGIETTAAIRAREAEIRGSGARPAPSGSSFAPERPRKGPIPIIALTAHAMSGHREQCLAAGMDAFVSKPIQAEMLAAVLERIAGAKPAGSAESASPLFDVSRALKAAGGHGGLLAELAHLFAEDQPRQIARLGAAIHAGDGATARAVAHTIKGSAATLGATAVRDLAIRIETVGREGGLDAAGPLVEALGQEVARVIASFAEAGYLPTSGSETDSI
jgi:CheY-like chemotaxis protein/HPt (histidine-containing phosphotransfer) domain-containing protein